MHEIRERCEMYELSYTWYGLCELRKTDLSGWCELPCELYEVHKVCGVCALTEYDEEDGYKARAGEEQRSSSRPVHQEVSEHLPAELEQPHLIQRFINTQPSAAPSSTATVPHRYKASPSNAAPSKALQL